MLHYSSKMAMPVLVAVFFLFLIGIEPANALHYSFVDTQPVCFAQEVYARTNAITGKYRRRDAKIPGVDMQMRLIDPDGNEVAKEALNVGARTFSISLPRNHAEGQYTLCAEVTTPHFVSKNLEEGTLVEFNIEQSATVLGDEEAVLALSKRQQVDGLYVFTYTDFGGQKKDLLQSKEYIESLEKATRQLERTIKDVFAKTEVSVERELRMRRTSESTFTRVWTSSLIVILVAGATVWFQFGMLKRTIKRKKLV